MSHPAIPYIVLPTADAILLTSDRNLKRSPTTVATASDTADADDVRAVLSGDKDRYERIIDRHQSQMSKRMWRFSRQHDIHEQLVHDVFVSAYRSLSSWRGDAPFIHWLSIIAVRTGYEHWREKERSRRVQPVDDPTILNETLDHAASGATNDASERAADAAELVAYLLDRLPPRDRLVLTLIYLDDMNTTQVSTMTGMSQTMVKVQAWRARQKLKKILDAEGIKF